jgi:hypothetical protein
MQVSNQSSANALLANSKDRMDPQQLQLRKLFAQKQQQLGIKPGGAADLGATSPANAAKAMKAAAKLDPALATTAPGGTPTDRAVARWFGTTPGGAPGDAGTATIAPLPAELASELTVEGLMSRWGQSDAAYDLDKSGTVGMNDLVMLLSEQGPTTAAAPAKLEPDGDPMEEVLTLGTTDPMAPVAEGEGEGDGAPAPELTMEGLMKSWGSDDPMYDLDGDGTVGMNDLLTMLAQSGIDAASALGTGATPGGPATPDEPAAELTVDGFAAAWGSNDPMYDLDGDGTVGMNDLLTHLATVAPTGAGDAVPATPSAPGELGVNARAEAAGLLSDIAPKSTDPAKPDVAIPGVKPEIKPDAFDPASTLAATLDSIATAPAPGDVNPLGTTGPVGGDATTGSKTAALDPAMLGGPSSYWNMAGAIAGEGSIGIETLAGLTDANTQAGAIESPEAAADIIAKQLHTRLESFGFNDAPPSNLHEILDGLRLADGDRKMVLERMQGMYPDGLGLNLVG